MAAATNLSAHLGVRRVTVAHFLIAEVVLLAVVPFVDQLPNGELIESALMTFVLLMAVLAVGGRRKTLIIAAVLLAPAALGRWLDHFRPGLVSKDFTNVASIVFVAFVIMHLLHFILHAPRVNNEVLCAGVATYLMLGILWAFAYLLAARLDPGSFLVRGDSGPHRPLAGYEALFVSFGTLANVPFDEVSLVSKPARMLAMTQAMTGMFYVAVLIARLVAIYSGNEPTQPAGAPDHVPAGDAR
jgi:hypothetical protein